MKLFTITLDTVSAGAYGAALKGLAISTELRLSPDCVHIANGCSDSSVLVSRASIEVWNLSRYLVPERKAGSALLFIGFDFHDLSGGELIGERLIRLGLGENCAFAQTEHDKTYSFSGKEKIIATRTTIFTASFSGSFLRVQRDGKPMEPDSVID